MATLATLADMSSEAPTTASATVPTMRAEQMPIVEFLIRWFDNHPLERLRAASELARQEMDEEFVAILETLGVTPDG